MNLKNKKKLDEKNMKEYTENRNNYDRAPILSYIYMKSPQFIQK